MENIIMKMEVYTLGIGLTIFNLVQVLNFGGIRLNIMENIIMVKKKELELFTGLIIQFIKENGKIMLLKGMAYINLGMGKHILEIGKIIKWMDMENFYEMKEKNFVDIIKMIKKRDLAYFFGLIILFIQVFGNLENKMEWENI